MVEQQGGQMVRDTDTDQHLPTDQIMEEEATAYQVPGQDDKTPDGDAKTISSTSTTNYDREEVETSLTNITEAFHTIAQEYEKLTGTIPHMSKVQAAQVITRLPVLPALKQELKAENQKLLRRLRQNQCLGPDKNCQLLKLKDQQRYHQRK